MATKRTTKPTQAVKPSEPTGVESIEDETVELREVEGYELLTPVEELTSQQQLMVVNAFRQADDPDRAEWMISLIDLFERALVVDRDGWAEFNRGVGALSRVSKLVTAYFAEVGKDVL